MNPAPDPAISPAKHIVGISIAESDELLALGYGREHLREALLTICRPLLRAGADLAYGGHLKDPKSSFTRDLLDLIASEQGEAWNPVSLAPPTIGRLYNPQAWPHYLNLTAEDEARWIDACTFVRVDQAEAGFEENLGEVLSTADEHTTSVRLAFNRAVVHSRMRRLMVAGIPMANLPRDQWPRLTAAVLIGGKTRGFRGVLPGIFEEVLCALEAELPVYLVGGFGGAAARLSEFLLGERTFEIDSFRHPGQPGAPVHLPVVEEGFRRFRAPPGARSPSQALEELGRWLDRVRSNIPAGLHNGLEFEENQRLMKTADMSEAARLIHKGVQNL